MSRYLFTNWEGGGHVFPMLMVARDLRTLGHDVLFVSDACNAADAAALDVPFQSWKKAPNRTDKLPGSAYFRDFELERGPAILKELCTKLMIVPAGDYAADVLEILKTFPADMVVTHEFLFGVLVGAEAAGVPSAIFTSTIWMLPSVDDAPPPRDGASQAKSEAERDAYRAVNRAARANFNAWTPGLNAARASAGLAPLDNATDQLESVGKVLLGTSRSFDFDHAAPPNAVYVGPYVGDPAGLTLEPAVARFCEAAGPPLVLVAMSTMYQRQEAMIANVLLALADMPVRGLMTLGPGVDGAAFISPPNVMIVPAVSHGAVLKHAQAVISQGGHGAVMRALMAGVPVLCLPKGRDQLAIAARAVWHGTAVALAADAPPGEIAAALRRLLDEPRFGEQARLVGSAIAKEANRGAHLLLAALAQAASTPS